MRSITARLALLAATLVALALPAFAAATATPAEISNALGKGVTYLRGLQTSGGEIAGFGGDWALTGLASAGTAAADVDKAGLTGHDARSWYEGVVGTPGWPEGGVATDFERGALLAYAAGIDPARVSKRQNLIAKVASTYQPASPGYYGETLNATVFGLLVLGQVKTTGGVRRFPPAVLEGAAAALDANQHTDGGWTWQKAAGNPAALESPSEPDMTGAAMAALCGAGVPASNAAIVAGREYLATDLNKTTGAFESEFGANTDSTAWAVAGLKACGIDPQGAEFTGGGTKKPTPLNYLINQQVTGGGFRYTTGMSANEYGSQDAVRALAGGGFTAVPPKPASGPQWTAVTEFATGGAESTSLALVVETGTGAPAVCSVTPAPGATTTTLATVLSAAVAGTTPAGCVTGFQPSSGTGAITQVNGRPTVPAERWKVSIDGGAKVTAKRSTVIHVGDTIDLSYE
ncbi:MAG TPA: prenyltransferase/squalene oxidase repeat-containing protein [Solirubrobacterales bacterium]|jgi:hypothetical protein